MKPVFVFISTCLLAIAAAGVSALGQQKWTPVPPGGPDSSPDYSWEKSDSGCLRPTDQTYRARLDALGTLLFGTVPSETKGCVTGVYLENGYSALVPEMTNHAGIDFRVVDGETRVYSPISGKVVLASLNATAGASTLTIGSDDGTYNVLLLHCVSHEHRRNGLPAAALKEGVAVQKGDQVCVAGGIGATAAHLHVEMKRTGQDARRLKAMFGGKGACRKSPCTLADIRANTADPTALVSGGRQTPAPCPTVSLESLHSERPKSVSVDLDCDGRLEQLSYRDVLNQNDPYFLVIEQLTVSDSRGRTVWRSPGAEDYSGPAPHLTSTEHHSTKPRLIADVDDDGKTELLVAKYQTFEENGETSWEAYSWNGRGFVRTRNGSLGELPDQSGKFVWAEYSDQPLPRFTSWIEDLAVNGTNLVATIRANDSRGRITLGEAIVSFNQNGMQVVRWLKPLKRKSAP